MRSALVLAAGCLMLLGQPGFAYHHEYTNYVRFSRPNTSYSAFMWDRSDCLKSTTRHVHEHYVDLDGERFFGVNLQYPLREFVACMKARGYVPDPNGYRAIGYQIDSKGRLWGVPMDEWND